MSFDYGVLKRILIAIIFSLINWESQYVVILDQLSLLKLSIKCNFLNEIQKPCFLTYLIHLFYRQILTEGGSAVDAYISVSLALGVTRTTSSGIGGGGHLNFYKRQETLYLSIPLIKTLQIKGNTTECHNSHKYSHSNTTECHNSHKYSHSNQLVIIPIYNFLQ